MLSLSRSGDEGGIQGFYPPSCHFFRISDDFAEFGRRAATFFELPTIFELMAKRSSNGRRVDQDIYKPKKPYEWSAESKSSAIRKKWQKRG